MLLRTPIQKQCRMFVVWNTKHRIKQTKEKYMPWNHIKRTFTTLSNAVVKQNDMGSLSISFHPIAAMDRIHTTQNGFCVGFVFLFAKTSLSPTANKKYSKQNFDCMCKVLKMFIEGLLSRYNFLNQRMCLFQLQFFFHF